MPWGLIVENPLPELFQLVLDPISDQDIEWICEVMGLPCHAFAGEDGVDSRLAVMRSLDTLDIEACPGSGKTTLLVAKLAILVSKWKPKRQGICVLSHTNAARIEIGQRLNLVSAGQQLLRYPHFVGTIHSFVNEFLAIPWLRSKGWSIKVVDDDMAQKYRLQRLPWGTRTYLEKQHEMPLLRYTQPDFSGNAGPADTATYAYIVEACKRSTEAGYYRFDEMFVWAAELLNLYPQVTETIRRRFPFVFIDEVQDNSELQSAFLNRLFMDSDGPVVRQRFGDSNQAIYHSDSGLGAATDVFPGPHKVDLPNSFRFGHTIAAIAAPLGIRPQPLVGKGPAPCRINHASCQNALFLFNEASVLGVLPAYAQYLIEVFSAEALAEGNFAAVSAVHRGDKHDHLPRFMGHYVPEYDPDIAGRQPSPKSLAQYFALARLESASNGNSYSVVNRFAEAVLHLLRLVDVEVPIALRMSPHRYLLDRLPDEISRQCYLKFVGRLIVNRCKFSMNEWEYYVIPTALSIAQAIVRYSIGDPSVAIFLKWDEGDIAVDATVAQPKQKNFFQYPQNKPLVSIRLGSIHSVKGETHTATLVLDSYRKAHHLKMLLPWLTGKKPKPGLDNSGESAAQIERLKLHYVGVTRPSHLLCMAIHKDSIKQVDLDKLIAKNWRVIGCSAIEPPAEM